MFRFGLLGLKGGGVVVGGGICWKICLMNFVDGGVGVLVGGGFLIVWW